MLGLGRALAVYPQIDLKAIAEIKASTDYADYSDLETRVARNTGAGRYSSLVALGVLLLPFLSSQSE